MRVAISRLTSESPTVARRPVTISADDGGEGLSRRIRHTGRLVASRAEPRGRSASRSTHTCHRCRHRAVSERAVMPASRPGRRTNPSSGGARRSSRGAGHAGAREIRRRDGLPAFELSTSPRCAPPEPRRTPCRAAGQGQSTASLTESAVQRARRKQRCLVRASPNWLVDSRSGSARPPSTAGT